MNKVTKALFLVPLVVILMGTSASAGRIFDTGMEFKPTADNTVCLDLNARCNDVKFTYLPAGPEFFQLVGYEYGCGDPTVTIHGGIRIDGNTAHISYVGHCTGFCDTPQLGQTSVQLNLITMQGPGEWAWHYGGYHWGAGDYYVVPCPVTQVEAVEPNTRDAP